MFTIDLLKGEGIPARSRPEGIVTIAIAIIVPVAIAIAMLGIYFSNRVVINVQKREISNYDQKIAGLSDAMKMHRFYKQQKSTIKQRISRIRYRKAHRHIHSAMLELVNCFRSMA